MTAPTTTRPRVLGLSTAGFVAVLIATGSAISLAFWAFVIGFVRYCDGTASGYCAQRLGSASPWWAVAVLLPAIPAAVAARVSRKLGWVVASAGLATALLVGVTIMLLVTQN